jgi:hypothetical protein
VTKPREIAVPSVTLDYITDGISAVLSETLDDHGIDVDPDEIREALPAFLGDLLFRMTR